MIKINDTAKCSGCMACVLACPNSAIATDSSRGYVVARVDMKKCVDCGRCEEVCPYHRAPSAVRAQKAYIAYSECEDDRAKSTAGGVFAALARRTLAHGGVVFGAAYTDDGASEMIAVEDAARLESLLGRKYEYTNPVNSYAEVKELLLSGREVLYAGTPCQIAGLSAFLGAPYPTLLRVEVGCGGVATERVWRAFLQELGEPEMVTLTNRIADENRAGICFTYGDGTQKFFSRNETGIHQAISLGLGIRPSCVNCAFSGKKSCADLSLCRYNPALEEKGLDIRRQPMTLVLQRSAVGGEALDDIMPDLNCRQIPLDQAYRHITRARKEKKYSSRSRAFAASLARTGFSDALNRYSRQGLAHAALCAVRSIFFQ